jgi:threonine dehydrogenase-like Zn-dependent dehydrogenase
MQQLTYIEGGRVEWDDVEAPAIGSPGQAIVEPLAVATCDLDRAVVEGLTPFEGPFAMGHEMIGRVVEAGDDVGVARPGDRVVVPYQVSCGECARCQRGLTESCKQGGMYGIGAAGGSFGGALSDRVLVPFADAMLVPLPEGVDPATAASAPDNIADAWRSIVPPLRDRPNGRVLILAGPGANSIPLYGVQIARASGAESVAVLTKNADTAAKAERLGAKVELVGEWPESFGRHDVVLEHANEREGLATALSSLRPGGHCTSSSMHFGGVAEIPVFQMFLTGVTFTTGRAPSRPLLEPVLELIASGAIDPSQVTSETASWGDAPEALLGYTTKLVVTRDGEGASP